MSRLKRLEELVDEYKKHIKSANLKDISEETIRTWINELLAIFNWDVKDTNQVLQEQILDTTKKEKLKTIDSTHTKPDYTLVNGRNIKSFLDAKSLEINLFTHKAAGFQIKSYGWSANVPCAFISNFEQLVIYDCSNIPNKNQNANVGAVQLTVDEYIDNFDLLERYLLRENIINNELDRIYEKDRIEGIKKLDTSFNELLSEFRLVLAENLVKNNSWLKNDTISLNYYDQVILDRIIFIRVCESKQIEEEGLLKSFGKQGFWDNFRSSCYMEFYERYDGALFARNKGFQKLIIEDHIFNGFIENLYYPNPYRFNVMPVSVIAKIYEEFLTYELDVKKDHVEIRIKDDYIRTNGVIATPEYLVRAICQLTIDLTHIKTIEELFKLKILDPCCGSGVFIIVAYELLEEKAKEILKSQNDERNNKLYKIINDNIYLTVECRQGIIKNCIFGIDYDEVAIEVTKMSLALKIIDDCDFESIDKIGLFGGNILKDIHKNILLGNTLVDSDIDLDIDEISQVKAINIHEVESYEQVFKINKGFDYVIGNPPYVETKHYKHTNGKVHEYLNNKYKAFEGKADLSVLFIERCLSLLNSKGKLGFIVQRRWFKTDYGKCIRNLISENKYMYKLIDIETPYLFTGRTVYTSIMILDKNGTETVKYLNLRGIPLEVKTFFESSNSTDYKIIPTNFFYDKTWSPESYEIIEIISKLKERFGSLGERENIKIKDGIQALYKKIYHLKNCKVKGDYIIGENGLNETIEIEKSIMKPIIYNKSFYPFKKVIPSAYCIFPYEGDNYNNPISIDTIKDIYPKAYDYLNKKKDFIKENVRYLKDNQYWHCFTRVHNHGSFMEPKIIIPMTAKDTIATLELNNGLYMDNANVWFISIENGSEIILKALTALVNSTIFSVMGKARANPQANGYYKFNKQFLEPIPLNKAILDEGNKYTVKLANIFDEISNLQKAYLVANEQYELLYRTQLNKLWFKLDEICYELYDIDEIQKNKIKNIGRTVDRVEILR